MKNQNFKNTSVIVGMIAILLMLLSSNAQAAMPSFASNEGIYLLDTVTGDALVAQNENEKFYPASTTKMMTALVAMDYISDKLDESVVAGEEITQIDADSSVAKLVIGDSYTWQQLLYGLLLPSGNDAAMTIAVNIARISTGNSSLDTAKGVSTFADLMNQKAESLGLENTHFENPHGLDDDNHYTTPKAMATIAQAVFENPILFEITSSTQYSGTSGNGTALTWENSNILIIKNTADISESQATAMNLSSGANPFYNTYAIAGKTGYAEKAGRCLVFLGEGDEIRMVGVIYKASDQTQLYNQASSALTSAMIDYTHTTWSDGQTPIADSWVSWSSIFDGFKIEAVTDGTAMSTVLRSEQSNYRTQVAWDQQYFEDKGNHLKLLSSFKKGQSIGSLDVYNGDKIVKKIPIQATKDMSVLGILDYALMVAVLAIIALIIFMVVHLVRKKRAKGVRQVIQPSNSYPIESDKDNVEWDDDTSLPFEHMGQSNSEDKMTDITDQNPLANNHAKLGGKTHYKMKRHRKETKKENDG